MSRLLKDLAACVAVGVVMLLMIACLMAVQP